MNRRGILKLYCLGAPAPLLEGCDTLVPRKNTNVNGEVIDQDGKPLKGVKFTLNGDRKTGHSGVPTFIIDVSTDDSGQFSISRDVPKDTDSVFFFLEDSDTIKIHNPGANYKGSLEKVGKYEPLSGSVIQIDRDNWGETINLKFKYEKL